MPRAGAAWGRPGTRGRNRVLRENAVVGTTTPLATTFALALLSHFFPVLELPLLFSLKRACGQLVALSASWVWSRLSAGKPSGPGAVGGKARRCPKPARCLRALRCLFLGFPRCVLFSVRQQALVARF